MSLDLALLRTTLETILTGVPDCRGYSFVPPAPVSSSANLVAVVVEPGPGQYVSYNESFSGTATKALCEVVFHLRPLIPYSEPETAQRRLDQLLSAGTGATRSIPDVLQANRTLSGTVEDSQITEASEVGVITLDNGMAYLTCRLELEIYLRRT